MSDDGPECPVCGDGWDWATSNYSNQTVPCSQAESFCITDDGIYFHNQ